MSIKTQLFILLVLLSMLAIRAHVFYRSQPIYAEGQRVRLNAVVAEEPRLAFGKQRVKIYTTGGMRVTLVTQAAPMYQYGDDLVIEGVFTESKFEGHTYWIIYFPSVQYAKKDHNFITNAAYSLRNEAKKLTESMLPPASASLLLGIVIGGKHGMPDAFLENLRTVGVLHVIAASGMNVSFVAVFLMGFLATFFKRPLALFTAMVGISFYVIVAGFEPSIIRAAIMTSFAMIAAILGRQSVAIWTLCLAGYVMLLHSPWLWEDVGFQLSFLATLGILTVKPALSASGGAMLPLPVPWKNIMRVNDDIMTSLAAQIATLPILLGVFGSYGVLSLLVNALILWTIPVLMVLGSLGILVGLVFAPLGQIFLLLAYPFLLFFELVVNFFGETGWALQIPEVPVVVWIGYYLVLTAVVLVNKGKLAERKEELILREV